MTESLVDQDYISVNHMVGHVTKLYGRNTRMKSFLSTIFLTAFCIVLLVVIAFIGFQRFIQYYKNIPICAGKPPVQKLVIAYKCGRSSHKELDAIFKEAKTLFPSLRQLIIFYDIPRKVCVLLLQVSSNCRLTFLHQIVFLIKFSLVIVSRCH